MTGLLVFMISAPLLAGPISLPKSASKAEDRLRVWLDQDPGVHAKINLLAASAQPDVFAAEFSGMDQLKDAVAQAPQKERVSRLPAMQVPQSMGCMELEECAAPPLFLDVSAGQPLEHAIRAMLRPWLWLGSGLALASTVEGARVLTMSNDRLGLPETALNVKTRTDGGFQLWFDRDSELSGIYAREREVRLRRARP